MATTSLSDSEHVVRYVKPTSIYRDGSIDIRLRQNEGGLSFHWLECFGEIPKEEQLTQARKVSRVTMNKNGRLVEWQVGETRKYLQSRTFPVQFVSKPLPANQTHIADPSHGEIEGVPPGDSPQANRFGDLIAECIIARHPTTDP